MDKIRNMSEEEGEKIGVNLYDDEESSPLEESIEEGIAAQPVEVVREEIVTVLLKILMQKHFQKKKYPLYVLLRIMIYTS